MVHAYIDVFPRPFWQGLAKHQATRAIPCPLLAEAAAGILERC